MQNNATIDISYFPGCSLVTSAHENNESLVSTCKKLGVNLIELDDWNCCGSSSAHSINTELFINLVSRNLSIADPTRPLMAPCPSCVLRLHEAFHHLNHDEDARNQFEKNFGSPFNPKLKIMNFLELLDEMYESGKFKNRTHTLNGLKFVTYYGCTLNRPPFMRHEKSSYNIIEKVLSSFGAEPVSWSQAVKCCGTYLSVAQPEIITPIVNKIVGGAKEAGAECIITPCAMCHLNLEVRCNLKQQVPTLHLSEVLAIALGTEVKKEWFARHLVDPRRLLQSKGLMV